MKISKVINDDSDGEGDSAMPLSGCEIRFNPFTGRRISVADKKVLKTKGYTRTEAVALHPVRFQWLQSEEGNLHRRRQLRR